MKKPVGTEAEVIGKAPGEAGAALGVSKETSPLKSCTRYMRQGKGCSHHECPHLPPQKVALTGTKPARSRLPQPVAVLSGHVAHVAVEGEG